MAIGTAKYFTQSSLIDPVADGLPSPVERRVFSALRVESVALFCGHLPERRVYNFL